MPVIFAPACESLAQWNLRGWAAADPPSLTVPLFGVMRVQVYSMTTGELLWDCVNGSFWQARGWELRMWICEAVNCRQYFSLILIVRQLLLRDMAFVGEYAEENTLTVYVLRREIADSSDFDLRQAAEAIRRCNRLGLWAVLSRGVHMRVILPAGTARVNPLVLAIQANYQEDPDLEYELPDTVLALGMLLSS